MKTKRRLLLKFLRLFLIPFNFKILSKYKKSDKHLNVYCIGSSVFTTGGHNNPSFHIIQLSLRLGEHLSKKTI